MTEPTAAEIVTRVLQRKINASYELGLSPGAVREEVDAFCERLTRKRREWMRGIKAGESRAEAFRLLNVRDVDEKALECWKETTVWEVQQIVYPRNRLLTSIEKGQHRNLFGYKDVPNVDKKRQKEFEKLDPFVVPMFGGEA